MESILDDANAGDRTELRIASKDLVRRDDGRLTEVPELLAEVELLQKSLARTFKEDETFDPILAEPGAYVIPVRSNGSQHELNWGEEPAPLFARTLESSREKLQANLDSDSPTTAKELGLSVQLVRTAAQLTRVKTASDGVSVRQSWLGTDSELAAADPLTFTALIKAPTPAKRVDGAATAAGPGTLAGARLEVNETTMYLVPGLSFEEAIDLVRVNARVTGKAVTREHQAVLEDAQFHVQPSMPL